MFQSVYARVLSKRPYGGRGAALKWNRQDLFTCATLDGDRGLNAVMDLHPEGPKQKHLVQAPCVADKSDPVQEIGDDDTSDEDYSLEAALARVMGAVTTQWPMRRCPGTKKCTLPLMSCKVTVGQVWNR